MTMLSLKICLSFTITAIFEALQTRDKATYKWPWLKGGWVKSSKQQSNSCPWDLLKDMQYASLNGNCVRNNWYDCPNGSLNLNLIRGIRNTVGGVLNVWAVMQFFSIFIIFTLVLLVSPSLLARLRRTIQMSPSFKIKVCGGTPALLKLFRTTMVNKFRRISLGSSTSHNLSAELKICLLLLFLFWISSFQ